jgi:integral membrane sensor domain MASE1
VLEPASRVAALDRAMPPPAWASRAPAWAWLSAFAAGSWLLREAAYLFTDRPGGLAVVWPAAGLTLFALLVARRRYWPVVLAVVFAFGAVGSLRFGRTPAQAVAFNAAHVVEAVVAAVAGIVAAFAAGIALLRIPGAPTHEIVLLPPLLWAAVALGPRGATVALTLGTLAFVALGPAAALAAAPGAAGILEVQVFIGVAAVSILAVAAVGEERRAAEGRRVLLERASAARA